MAVEAVGPQEVDTVTATEEGRNLGGQGIKDGKRNWCPEGMVDTDPPEKSRARLQAPALVVRRSRSGVSGSHCGGDPGPRRPIIAHIGNRVAPSDTDR